MNTQELDTADLVETFYNAMRGFIVIEESGLPDYIEFLTEEKIDVILLAGLLSGLQTLSETVSEEKIRSIETSNSKFLFEIRDKYFYVIWIEKTLSNLELYDPIIMKIISRYEGARKEDLADNLLISNLTETPDYEIYGRRLVKIRTVEAKTVTAYRKLMSETADEQIARKIANEFAGITGLMVISEEETIEHREFPTGGGIFDIETLSNFLIGLRKAIRNLDPGTLEEVTTRNYRFILREGEEHFYIFQIMKGLAEEEQLARTILKIISRYEGLRRKHVPEIELLKDLDVVLEHEVLGQLTIDMRELVSEETEDVKTLERQKSKISFASSGSSLSEWEKEEELLNSFLDVYGEVFLAGIITKWKRFFVIKRTPDINDWIHSARGLAVEKLMEIIIQQQQQQGDGLAGFSYEDKLYRLLKINNETVLLVVLDQKNSAAERYMLRLPKIIQRISKNLS